MENIDKINQVKELLDDIRPFLNMEGGDIEFIKLEDDYVYVKLTGACAMCGYQDVTLKDNNFHNHLLYQYNQELYPRLNYFL